MSKLEPEITITNFLNANLTDLNSGNRVGTNWIFPDFPRTKDLGLNSFPRVGILKLAESAERIGLFDDTTLNKMSFQIDVFTKKGLVLTITTTDESLGTISNSPRLQLDERPLTMTNVKHTITAFGTINIVTDDDSFTTPGSLSAGTVEVSGTSGRLNFSSADLASFSGENITSSYTVGLEGDRVCMHLSRRIISLFRTLWRTDSKLSPLFYPNLISNNVIPFEEDNGIFRRTIEYELEGFTAGE